MSQFDESCKCPHRKCANNNRVFDSTWSLHQHMKTVHGRSVQCKKGCGRAFYTPISMQRHAFTCGA
jgi:hypothetical protein